MTCAACQRDNPAHARFCVTCGAAIGGTGARGDAGGDTGMEVDRLQRALAEAREQQAATSDILKVIGRFPADAQPVFETIADAAARLFGAWSVGVYRFDGELVDVAAVRGGRPDTADYIRGRYPMRLAAATSSVAAQAIAERVTQHVPDTEGPEHSRYREVGRVRGYRATLAVPMLRRGEPIGSIAVTRVDPGPFSAAQIALLEGFAAQAVIAIENVRMFRELEARNAALAESLKQQTATGEILRVISSSPADVRPVLDIVAENAARLCEAEDVSILKTDEGLFRVIAFRGARRLTDFEGAPLSHDSVAGRAVLERRLVHVRDIMEASGDEFPVSKGFAPHLGHRTMLAMPLLREDTAIGAIFVRRTEVRPFSDKQIQLLKTFADQAVIAIENVRLFTELETRTRDLTRSVGELQALSEVGQAIGSTLDLRAVLSTIVARATHLSGTDAGVIYEYDEQREVFLPRATERLETAIVEMMLATPVRRGEGATGRLADNPEPVQLPDIQTAPTESRVRGALVGAGYRALLAVPLVREGRLLGGLTVIRKATGAFSPQVVELLRTFATQSSLAIQNARLYREIEDKSRQLETASRHKSEFLANMSHELRTPLNAIIGYAEMLQEEARDAGQDGLVPDLEKINGAGRHLLELINDILDLSKIEAGRMELELTDVDLAAAIAGAVTLVRERAARRGISLETSVDPRLGVVRADERKIRQVVLNLLSNAIKFTPEGGRIDVAAMPRDGAAEVSVSDTGVGIAPEDQGVIFDEFRQVGTAAKKIEGTGLGLALARRFIELHGGQIRVASRLGVGSTFTFTLPVRRGG